MGDWLVVPNIDAYVDAPHFGPDLPLGVDVAVYEPIAFVVRAELEILLIIFIVGAVVREVAKFDAGFFGKL